MNMFAILVALYDGAKAISPVVLAVLSGLGMILTKGLGWGISEIFQALTLVFSGFSFAGLKNAVVELSALLQGIQVPATVPGNGQGTGEGPTAETGTTPAAPAK